MLVKLNNKGFAISTILYGLLALLILIVMFTFQIMRTSNNNNKSLGEQINSELKKCQQERIDFKNCIDDDDCTNKKNTYNTCLNS